MRPRVLMAEFAYRFLSAVTKSVPVGICAALALLLYGLLNFIAPFAMGPYSVSTLPPSCDSWPLP